MNGWMVQWYGKRPAWATRIVAEPPGATVPESKLPPLSAVSVWAVPPLFVILMGTPCRAVSVRGVNLKSLIVMAESECDAAAAGALELPLAPPPHPASAATDRAIKATTNL